MGCGFTTAKTNWEGTSHAIRVEMDTKMIDHVAAFHDTFILDQKISQSVFGQINLARKVAMPEPSRNSQRVSGLQRRLSRLSSSSSQAEVIEYTAVKVVNVRSSGSQILKLVQNEMSFWKDLSGKHIMELRETFHGPDLCYMVMERCIGSLSSYIQRAPELNERTLGECFAQMLMGIEFLHSKDIVHRSIKPDSFLVGIEDEKKVIKMCDFTFAITLSPGQHQHHGKCGAPLFMCPEMVTGKGYDTKADVWSFGVIVYALLFGRFPFDNQNKDSEGIKSAIQRIVVAAKISFKTTVWLSGSCIAFVMCLLEKDPSARPSSSEALEKAYMTAVIAEDHLISKRLPDLRPMFEKVKQFRSFEYHGTDEKSMIDDVLNRNQLSKHGIPLPQVRNTSLVIGLSSPKVHESAKQLGKRNSSKDSLDLASVTLRKGQRNSLKSFSWVDGLSPESLRNSATNSESDDDAASACSV
jgi:serine/threonine protein kinase